MNLFHQNQDTNLFAPHIQKMHAQLHIPDDDAEDIRPGRIVALVDADTLFVVKDRDIAATWLRHYDGQSKLQMIEQCYSNQIQVGDKESLLGSFGLEAISRSTVPFEKNGELFPSVIKHASTSREWEI